MILVKHQLVSMLSGPFIGKERMTRECQLFSDLRHFNIGSIPIHIYKISSYFVAFMNSEDRLTDL